MILFSVAAGAVAPVQGSPPAMSIRDDHDLSANKLINNRVGKFPHDHSAVCLIIFRPTQRALGNYPETAFNLAFEIFSDRWPASEIPSKCRLIVFRCAGMENGSSGGHERASWLVTLLSSREEAEPSPLLSL